MIPMRVYFKKFSEITLFELVNNIGVYVIWDSQSKAKPTYIGEGNLLNRLAEHDDRFAEPLDGYIAITGPTTKKGSKADSRMLETLLIRIGEETDRAPKYTDRQGHWKIIVDKCRNCNKLKIYVGGYDPLRPPLYAKELEKPKLIDIDYEEDEEDVLYSHNWNRRRKLKNIF